jgi:hypothetical protein
LQPSDLAFRKNAASCVLTPHLEQFQIPI